MSSVWWILDTVWSKADKKVRLWPGGGGTLFLNPALRRLRQVDLFELETSLIYRVRASSVRAAKGNCF